jgi:hypothetical protein
MSFFILILFSVFNHAQVGSTSDSLGGVGAALANPTEASFINPAGLAFFSGGYFSGGYRSGKSDFGDYRQMSVVMADASEENLFSGSLAYRQKDFDFTPSIDLQEKDFIATAAYRRPSLAIGIRGYKKQTELVGENIDQYNGDLGLQWMSTEHFTVGITQSGMWSTKAVEQPFGVLPSTTVGAMFVIPQLAMLIADFSYAYTQNPNDRLVHSVGLSLQHIEFVSINTGLRMDDRSGETTMTAGLQFVGPRLKAGYAYQKEVRKELGEVHTFDISINL